MAGDSIRVQPETGASPEQVQTDAPFSTVLTFDWQRPPLHANQRGSWRKYAPVIRDVRDAAHWHARRIPNLGRIRVELVWVVKDRRRRDALNLAPLSKALVDGLVDAGVVTDDTPQFVEVEHSIEYAPRAVPHVELWIRQVRHAR